MSDLRFVEKTKLEKLLGMTSGYVLDFSNRTFQEFVAESVGLNIYDEKYVTGHSGSKANCLRSFWKTETNHLAGNLLKDLIEYFRQTSHDPALDAVADDCSAIAMRLIESPTMTTSGPLVFISYARPDLPVTHALTELLSDAGLRTWFDKKDLRGGQDWELVIRQRIAEAALVLVCLSTRSVNRKGFFHKEMRFAVGEATMLPKGKVYVMPLRLDDCELPDELRQWHAIDLFEPSGSYALLGSIGSALGNAIRARIEAHDALTDAVKPFHSFVVEEGQGFKLETKLFAADRCMYDVELSKAMLGFGAAKVHLRIRKHVVGQIRPETTHDDSRGMLCRESLPIAAPWHLLLERVEPPKAYFSIRYSG